MTYVPSNNPYPPPVSPRGTPMGVVPKTNVVEVIPVGGTSICPSCGHMSGAVVKRRMGTAACAWCWALLFTTAILWVVPVCCDYCKDTEYRCDRCGAIKRLDRGKCC